MHGLERRGRLAAARILKRAEKGWAENAEGRQGRSGKNPSLYSLWLPCTRAFIVCRAVTLAWMCSLSSLAMITSNILNQIDRSQFSLASFYERRIRRIFPALMVVTCFGAYTRDEGFCEPHDSWDCRE